MAKSRVTFSQNAPNLILNKHCEILVSCSDEERNCLQAQGTACMLMQLHARLCNCMKAFVTACACKLIDLHAF